MGKFLCDRLILFDFYLLICILFAMKEKHRSDENEETEEEESQKITEDYE